MSSQQPIKDKEVKNKENNIENIEETEDVKQQTIELDCQLGHPKPDD
jgi:hypothetical protein